MSLRALQIVRSGLLAHQGAIDITSGNVANVNTPGYTRRRPHLSTFVPEPGHTGSGVQISTLVEFRNRYLDAQIRGVLTRQLGRQTDELLLQRLMALFGDSTEGGVSALFQRFFDAVQQVVLQPEDVALRELVLQRADQLASTFRRLGADIEAVRSELLGQAQQRVGELNRLLHRVAHLNAQRALVPEGSEAAIALADEQTRLVEQIARLIPVTATVDARGMINLAVAGHMLVSGVAVLSLQLRTLTTAAGEHHAQLWLHSPAGEAETELSLDDGELGRLLEHYNVTLDPQERSAAFSLPRQLDRFVAQWVERVNGIFSGGYGLDDGAAPPPGRRFFEGTRAATLRLSADVAARPRALPLSDKPGEPGNAVIAQRLLALAELPIFGDGQTPQGFIAGVMSCLGELLSAAQQQREWLQASFQQLQAQRQMLSGVNLDEEAANLVRYQKAYEAVARVGTVAASLLETLIRMGT